MRKFFSLVACMSLLLISSAAMAQESERPERRPGPGRDREDGSDRRGPRRPDSQGSERDGSRGPGRHDRGDDSDRDSDRLSGRFRGPRSRSSADHDESVREKNDRHRRPEANSHRRGPDREEIMKRIMEMRRKGSFPGPVSRGDRFASSRSRGPQMSNRFGGRGPSSFRGRWGSSHGGFKGSSGRSSHGRGAGDRNRSRPSKPSFDRFRGGRGPSKRGVGHSSKGSKGGHGNRSSHGRGPSRSRSRR